MKLLFKSLCIMSLVIGASAYAMSESGDLDAEGWKKRRERLNRTIATENLYHAVKANNTQAAREALRSGNADPNSLTAEHGGYQEATMLEIAAKHQNEVLVELLLQHGANPNLLPPYGYTFPLDVAAEKGNMEIVARLLRAGASPNAWKQYPQQTLESTIIYAAQTENNAAILGMLLEAGAEVNDAGESGTTALMAAAFEGAINNVQFLLERGAQPNLKNKDGENALNLARRGVPRKTAHDEIVRILEPVTSQPRHGSSGAAAAAPQQ